MTGRTGKRFDFFLTYAAYELSKLLTYPILKVFYQGSSSQN